jgi:hypothetical protein
MSTFVRFLELLVLEHHNPFRLDYTTRIDESYFADNPDKKITSFEIEGFDGLEYCSVKLPEQIKEGYRGKTLASITMKLIYNNPFCHPYLLFKEVKRINDLYSEDPNPKNPKPDDEEVFKIVMFNYQRFLAGEMNFEKVLEKNNKNQIAKKHVFRSKHAKKQGKAINHIEGIKAYHKARTNHIFNKYVQAIKDLQDGCKITQKRIGVYMGMDERTIRRYQTPETKAMIKDYNDSLKKERACKSKPTPENEVEGYEPEAKIALSRPEEIQPSVNGQSPIPETNYETKPNQNTEPDIDFSVIEFVDDIIQPIEEPNEVDLEEVFKNIFEGFIKRNAGNDVEELRRLFKKHFDALGQNEKQLLLIPYKNIKDLTTSCKQANVENKLRNEVLEIYLDVVQ